MTDSLKEMAGETLRLWLTKFTGSPFTALCSGMGFTLAVQSSTATTLATIGFVSAGVLTFSQAIGVIIGANIGTTSTGWMVALLGVKFSITSFALPLIAAGAILKLLTHGRIALLGLCIAGFGLIFFGIDQLQTAMAGFAARVDLSVFSPQSIASQLLLVVIGIIMTVLLQSSSAAITATLAALASQAIQLEQALLLVIGQNVGTVATAVLAAIGASVNAQRTASIHVLFNMVSAVLAFFILVPCFMWLYKTQDYFSQLDHVLIVAAFHTVFSLLGACLMMPLIHQVEMLIRKLIPEREAGYGQYLDQASLSVPTLSIAAAERVLFLNIHDQLNVLKNALQNGEQPGNKKLGDFDLLLTQLDQYIVKITLPDSGDDREGLVTLLRLMVYAKVLRNDLENLECAVQIRTQPKLFQTALDYAQILEKYIDSLFLRQDKIQSIDFQHELLNLKQQTALERKASRNSIIEYAALNHLSASKNLKLLESQRWLEQLIAHSQRLVNVLSEAELLNAADGGHV